ncbi:MAG: hypothetical protein ACK58T_42645 [Phycisphaerae bacterium]
MTKYSLKELATLIKLCKKNGVSLKYDGLEILSVDVLSQGSTTPAPQARGSAKKALEVTEKAALQLQFDEAQEIAETLHVEDPVAYERMLIEGELGETKEDRRVK